MKYRITMAALLLVAASSNAQMLSSHAASLPAASASAPASTSMQVTGKPVARVNDAVLTDRDLLREMLALFPYARLHNGFPKGQEAEIRRGAMQMIIFEELVYQEALRRKMTIPPTRLAREEKKFKAQFSSRDEFNTYLNTEMNGSEAKLRKQITRSLLIEAMLKNEVENKSVVSLSEARAYYEKNLSQFEHGETFAFQTISILPPATANADTLKESRKKAEEIAKQAKATKNYEEFGLLAEKLSEDDFRVNMGDHHAVKRADLPVEVVKAMLAMKAGQVSDLVQLGNAFTVIRLNAHNAPGKAKFADVKAGLTEQLQKEKSERLRVSLDKRLHQNAKVQEL